MVSEPFLGLFAGVFGVIVMLISSLELDHTLSVIERGTFGIARAPRRRQFPLLLDRRDIGGDI